MAVKRAGKKRASGKTGGGGETVTSNLVARGKRGCLLGRASKRISAGRAKKKGQRRGRRKKRNADSVFHLGLGTILAEIQTTRRSKHRLKSRKKSAREDKEKVKGKAASETTPMVTARESRA